MYTVQKKTVKELVAYFKCGKSLIYSCLSNQDEIKQKFLDTKSASKIKRFRPSCFDKLNEILFQWFCSARAKNFPLSGPIIKTQATNIAARLNLTDFKGSNGWLRTFCRRYRISFKTVCGESNDVSDDVLAEWIAKLPDLCEEFEPKNIANCDETALFYRLLPSKSFTFSNEDCKGGKWSKERMTVLLTVFGDGSMIKPLVIGKSLKPRCFKNLNMNDIGVNYFGNRKAWMTSIIFEKYLTELNNKMRSEKRKILLFLDNASSHPNLHFSNITLQYLPANTTSKLQPLDAGIIANMKVHYKKLMLQNLLLEMEGSDSVTALTKKITVLDAINLLKVACKRISNSTIIKCFLNTGFLFEDDEQNEVDETEAQMIGNLIEIQNLIRSVWGSDVCSANDFVSVDDGFPIENDTINLDDFIDAVVNDETVELVSDEEEVVENVGDKEVLAALKVLDIFGRKSGNGKIYEMVNEIKTSYIQWKSVERKQKLKQSSILNFLKPN